MGKRRQAEQPAPPPPPTLKPHQETDPTEGCPRGRDPRQMSAFELRVAGVEKRRRGDAIRAFCIDCQGGSPAEVRRCGAIQCPLWAFRMGTDPWRREREISEEQRQAATERFREMWRKRKGVSAANDGKNSKMT